MNNQTKIGLVVIVLLVVSAMVWMFGETQSTNESAHETYVSDKWDKKYDLKQKDPYGLYLFNQLLRVHVDSAKTILPVVNSSTLDSLLQSNQPSTYLFVGNKFGLKTSEFDSILAQVSKGSDLFLSYNQLTNNLIKRLFIEHEISYDFADSVTVFINNNKFAMYYLYQNDTIGHEWRAYDYVLPIDTNYQTLSSFMEMSNFIRLKHGKGAIYLHTNPEFFFNYQIKRPEGFRYTSYFLNQMSRKQPVYLLELGRLLDYSYAYGDGEGDGDQEDSSYFRFLLKSPAFMAAMGLMLLGILLFVLFRSKRMQPIVPYIEKKKNMSLEFAQTITSIYHSKSNPMGILKVQRQNFYDAMQKIFFVDISRKATDRERALRTLSEKSSIALNELKELITLFEPKNQDGLNERYLAEVAAKQREIYVRTGVISERILEKVEAKMITIQRNLWLSVLFLLSGIFIILFGFYYLVISVGIGIVLWPLGAIILGLGIRRLNIPYLKIEKNSVVYFPIFGRKKELLRSDIMTIGQMKNGFQINFKEEKTIKINKFELSRFDRYQFEQFSAKHHQIDL